MNIHSPITAPHKRAPSWSVDDINLLCELWDGKVIVKHIARRLYRTAGAVTSKAHRIQLAPRRARDKRTGGGVQFTKSLYDKIIRNSNTLGISRSEYIRRACERCPVEVVAE